VSTKRGRYGDPRRRLKLVPELPDEDWRVAYAAKVQSVIDEHGWMVQFVGCDPPLAYTIGLTVRGLPELVVSALPPDVAAQVLNRAARLGFTAGDLVDIGFSVQFRAVPVTTPRTHMGVAGRMYGNRFTALQLLWPSKTGVWPGEEGWDGGPQQVLG